MRFSLDKIQTDLSLIDESRSPHPSSKVVEKGIYFYNLLFSWLILNFLIILLLGLAYISEIDNNSPLLKYCKNIGQITMNYENYDIEEGIKFKQMSTLLCDFPKIDLSIFDNRNCDSIVFDSQSTT